MSTDERPKYYETAAFKEEQRKAYAQLEAEGFNDIESGLDSPPLLKPHHRPLNSAAARAGHHLQNHKSPLEDQWTETLSVQDRWVDIANAGKARYAHHATLIAAQEYALCRLGTFRRASDIRASWALHAQGVSEREIARDLDIYRWDVEEYIDFLTRMVISSVASENAAC